MCNGRIPLAGLTCSQGVATPLQALPINGASYVAMAAAGDQFEIQSGQIALIKASSPDVRNFAQTLINDHTMTSSKLSAAASASGLGTPVAILSADQQQMLNDLQAAPAGFGFDQLFLKDQITAHQMALALHSNYANFGDTLALKAVAASAVPIIQMHLTTAENLMVASGAMMASDFCPANYWCNSDFDALGQSFAVCCPSDVPLFPPAAPVSVATTIYTPATAVAPAASGSLAAGYIQAFGTVVPVVRVPSNAAGGLYGNVPVGTPATPIYTATPLYTTVG
jgi:putative membrane protein